MDLYSANLVLFISCRWLCQCGACTLWWPCFWVVSSGASSCWGQFYPSCCCLLLGTAGSLIELWLPGSPYLWCVLFLTYFCVRQMVLSYLCLGWWKCAFSLNLSKLHFIYSNYAWEQGKGLIMYVSWLQQLMIVLIFLQKNLQFAHCRTLISIY